MEFVNIWHKEGWQKGLQEGLQLRRKMICLQVEQQTGTVSKQSIARIERLSDKQLEQLAVALLKFGNPRDLTRWLRDHAPMNNKTTKRPAQRNGRKTS